MVSNSAPKRSRVSAEQLSHMTDFMLKNPGLAEGRFQKLHGKIENDKKWTELTAMLNSLGGAVKNVGQWHTVWRDLKSRTSVKVRDRKRQQAMTGNRPFSKEPITEVERRIVSLIGKEYIEGHDSMAENIPVEEHFQLRLEDGDDRDVFAEIHAEAVLQTPKTPVTPARTPRSSLKRKRMEESDTQAKFLEIAKQQADSLKMLAEVSAANAEANMAMADAIKAMGDGLKRIADAVNNLSASI